MKAAQLNKAGELVIAEVHQPVAGPGQVLIRVHAAGVTPTEVDWYPSTHTSDGRDRFLAIPGHEFSGAVAAVGKGVNGFLPGDEIYGMNDWFEDGATAEYCITSASSITASPAQLTALEAATVPIGALTAWQGLFDKAALQPGERVLVHGGTGAVGLFAAQLAHLHGAHVIATASALNLNMARELGADEVIDYHAARFEDQARQIDVVFDTVGGETRDRSKSLLTAKGRMVTIAEDERVTSDPMARAAFFIVEPNQIQLREITSMLDSGVLRTFVKGVVRLENAASAYSGRTPKSRSYGKLVVAIDSL